MKANVNVNIRVKVNVKASMNAEVDTEVKVKDGSRNMHITATDGASFYGERTIQLMMGGLMNYPAGGVQH